MLDGDILTCGRRLGAITEQYPRDALALAAGHQVDFFTGDATTLRDRVGATLNAWQSRRPHYGTMCWGCTRSGWRRPGRTTRPEDTGLARGRAERRRRLGHPPVTHTYEMQGRFVEGTATSTPARQLAERALPVNVHNWWHYALYALEAGDTGRPCNLRRGAGAGGRRASRWRCSTPPACCGGSSSKATARHERWRALAAAWTRPGDAQPYYAFNDMHAVMSYVGAGRVAEAEKLIASRAAYLTVTRTSPTTP